MENTQPRLCSRTLAKFHFIVSQCLYSMHMITPDLSPTSGPARFRVARTLSFCGRMKGEWLGGEVEMVFDLSIALQYRSEEQ